MLRRERQRGLMVVVDRHIGSRSSGKTLPRKPLVTDAQAPGLEIFPPVTRVTHREPTLICKRSLTPFPSVQLCDWSFTHFA